MVGDIGEAPASGLGKLLQKRTNDCKCFVGTSQKLFLVKRPDEKNRTKTNSHPVCCSDKIRGRQTYICLSGIAEFALG